MCFVSDCIYFRQHNLCTDTLYAHYLLNISAFTPLSVTRIRCWLHCSPPLTLASVYIAIILCCRFDTIGDTVNLIGSVFTSGIMYFNRNFVFKAFY
jgi:hypothetical protein